LALITGVLTLFLRWGAFPSSAANVELQLFTLEEKSERVTEFPFGKKYVIALVAPTEDLTKQLPITLTVRHARVTATDRIPNDPAKYCKDIHICALTGPTISPKGTQTAIEITALGSDGKTLATFNQGTLPTKKSAETTASTPAENPDLPMKIKNLPGDPSLPFIQDPVAGGLSGIALISALGFVFSSRKIKK
jgi:hypothetical protein